jgi:hypothetical protein
MTICIHYYSLVIIINLNGSVMMEMNIFCLCVQ